MAKAEEEEANGGRRDRVRDDGDDDSAGDNA
jgi:hypothetical protein